MVLFLVFLGIAWEVVTRIRVTFAEDLGEATEDVLPHIPRFGRPVILMDVRCSDLKNHEARHRQTWCAHVHVLIDRKFQIVSLKTVLWQVSFCRGINFF